MSGSSAVSALNAPDPSFEALHEMLDNGANREAIDVEVRRLCLMCFVIGNERGVAYAVRMAKDDDTIDSNADLAMNPEPDEANS